MQDWGILKEAVVSCCFRQGNARGRAAVRGRDFKYQQWDCCCFPFFIIIIIFYPVCCYFV